MRITRNQLHARILALVPARVGTPLLILVFVFAICLFRSRKWGLVKKRKFPESRSFRGVVRFGAMDDVIRNRSWGCVIGVVFAEGVVGGEVEKENRRSTVKLFVGRTVGRRFSGLRNHLHVIFQRVSRVFARHEEVRLSHWPSLGNGVPTESPG